MTEEALDAVRDAFVSVLCAERKLRGREGHRAAQLSLSHYRMLSCLLDHGRLAAGRLAAAADLTPASTTQTLDLLERRGMVVRERDPVDRRVVVAVLTAEGRRLTMERRAQFRALWEEMLGDLSETELAAGVKVLGRVASVLDALAGCKAAADTEPAPAPV